MLRAQLLFGQCGLCDKACILDALLLFLHDSWSPDEDMEKKNPLRRLEASDAAEFLSVWDIPRPPPHQPTTLWHAGSREGSRNRPSVHEAIMDTAAPTNKNSNKGDRGWKQALFQTFHCSQGSGSHSCPTTTFDAPKGLPGSVCTISSQKGVQDVTLLHF